MALVLFLFFVPAALLMWKMCAVSAAADKQALVAFEEMMREKEKGQMLEQEEPYAG